MKPFEDRWPIKLLRIFCPEDIYESIVGDLEEQYAINSTSKSRWTSEMLFILNALQFLRPGIIKRKLKRNHSAMTLLNLFQNFIIIFFRSARKQLGFYALNLTSIIIGMVVAVLTVIYINNELSHDRFHPDADKIYRLTRSNFGSSFPSLSISLAKEMLEKEYAWMERTSVFSRAHNLYFKVDQHRFQNQKAVVTIKNDAFFELFGFELLYGKPDEVTQEENTIIISERTSKKYFGNEVAFGKSIYFDSIQFKVTGVFRDLPPNTHMSMDLILVNSDYFFSKGSGFFYFKTNQKDPGLIKKEILALTPEVQQHPERDINIENIRDIYLHSKHTFSMKAKGNKQQIMLYAIVAFIVLLISSSNFANLSNAIFSKRKKEVAVRKVLGSKKSTLTIQFLLESILMALLSVPLVFTVILLLLPYYNQFTGIHFTNEHVINPPIVWSAVGFAVITGVLGGIYPSLVMPRNKITRLFRNDFSVGKNISVRKSLITIQFTLLIGLASGAIIINQQLTYLIKKNTGIDRQGIIKLKTWELQGQEQIQTFKNRLREKSFVKVVSQGYVPGDENYVSSYQPEGFDEALDDALIISSDTEYLNLLGVKGIAGPFFEEKIHPEQSILINQTFVKNFNWEDPIGKKINLRPNGEPVWREVRGVYQDFNYFSLHQEIGPQLLILRRRPKGLNKNVLIKVEMSHLAEAMDWVKSVWDEIMPDETSNYSFLDDDITREYFQEQQTASISIVLTTLSILVSILGLIGITTFLTTLRTKELGVRKVLGASNQSLISAFCKEYIPLVVIATGAAGISTYLFLDDWLDHFAYRIPLNPSIFPFTGLVLMILVVITVGIESLKHLRRNPINALKHE